MSRAGRNAHGQFTRDDTALKDALAALSAAVAPVLDFMADPAMDAMTRIKAAHEGKVSLQQALAILEYVDVGEKPGKDSDDE